uniref:Uncharacterized protein n=1 Tax=Physcomitrium patens TaxID=3218 RepID=A0A2K1JQM1_PHYPA|nr:hypothetical protein PHYPA_016216 [Physcomitrium patens]
MKSVQAMVVLLLLAALLECVQHSEAGRTMLTVGSEKTLSSLLPSCSPPPAPVDVPYTPTTPDTTSPSTHDTYTPTTPTTPSEPSPVYSSPPPADGY